MENKFEEALKNKLNQLQLDDLGIKIEPTKEWEKLQEKRALPTSSHRKFIWSNFWTHVAALVAGIIISGVLYSIFYQANSNHPQPELTHNKPKTPTSVDQKIIQKEIVDTVYIVKESAESKQHKLQEPILKSADAQEKQALKISHQDLKEELNKEEEEGNIMIAQETIQPFVGNEKVKNDTPPILYWYQIKEEMNPRLIHAPANTLLTYLSDKSMDVNQSHSSPQSFFDYLK